MDGVGTVQVIDHQRAVDLGGWPRRLEAWAPAAWAAAWRARGAAAAPLGRLEAVDVALVDDAAIAATHGRFLGDPAPTDVLTFDHGEILIGAETAVRQAREFGEPLGRELLRYLVHGLLHLAGHDDRDAAGRERMEREQERIIVELWGRGGDAGTHCDP